MKLAISNFAWEMENEQVILNRSGEMGITGIEVAPTKIWPEWHGAGEKAARDYQRKLADKGFAIPSMQAILYGLGDLRVFDSATHDSFLEHFKLVAEIAHGFGTKVLVFGSRKNRRRGQLSTEAAYEMAAEFFGRAAEICFNAGCVIGIENVPCEYNCDFVTNVADARRLVDLVAHPGLALHIDSAGIHMCGGDMARVIANAGDFAHFHASEPLLAPLASGEVDHREAAAALIESEYDGWVSIEMSTPDNMEDVFDAVAFAGEAYSAFLGV